MSDRRLKERRDDERLENKTESANDERRGKDFDRRIVERLANTSIKNSTELILFWLKMLFVVIVSCGVFVLGFSLSNGIRQAGPGILISVFMFNFAYIIYTSRKWIMDYLSNESLTSFELLYEKLMEIIRFLSLLVTICLIIYIATSL